MPRQSQPRSANSMHDVPDKRPAFRWLAFHRRRRLERQPQEHEPECVEPAFVLAVAVPILGGSATNCDRHRLAFRRRRADSLSSRPRGHCVLLAQRHPHEAQALTLGQHRAVRFAELELRQAQLQEPRFKYRPLLATRTGGPDGSNALQQDFRGVLLPFGSCPHDNAAVQIEGQVWIFVLPLTNWESV